jgi:hypothetical protein
MATEPLTIDFVETKDMDGKVSRHSFEASPGTKLPTGAKPRVTFIGPVTCTGAGGKYSSPTTKVTQVYLENSKTKIQGSITQGGGFWSATFTNVPAGNYEAFAWGDDKSKATASVDCPG